MSLVFTMHKWSVLIYF